MHNVSNEPEVNNEKQHQTLGMYNGEQEAHQTMQTFEREGIQSKSKY